MFLRLGCFALALMVSGVAAAAPADYTEVMTVDAEGAADSPYTGRYEGSTIVGQTSQVFDELLLPAAPSDVSGKVITGTVSQKGKILRTLYVSPEKRSSLEVFGNYVDALKAKGFTVVFDCADAGCGKNFKDLKYRSSDPASLVVSTGASTRRMTLSRAMFNRVTEPRYAVLKTGEAGQETYISVFAAQNAGGSLGDASKALRDRVGVLVESVEAGAREEKIITISAKDIGTGLGAEGRVAFYGLYFDFDAATIKPESAPQLDEMIAYLNGNPDVRVFVVGHTDNSGSLEHNLKLSDARAKAVTAALVKAGIAGARLSAKGLGPYAPLVANTSPAAQAKNRRVELVAQ